MSKSDFLKSDLRGVDEAQRSSPFKTDYLGDYLKSLWGSFLILISQLQVQGKFELVRQLAKQCQTIGEQLAILHVLTLPHADFEFLAQLRHV